MTFITDTIKNNRALSASLLASAIIITTLILILNSKSNTIHSLNIDIAKANEQIAKNNLDILALKDKVEKLNTDSGKLSESLAKINKRKSEISSEMTEMIDNSPKEIQGEIKAFYGSLEAIEIGK